MAGELNFSDVQFTLSNGITMPAVGLGTFRVNSYDILYKTIDYALGCGYRLFDTAAINGNEKYLGNAFQELLPRHSLVREEIFITTKLSPASPGGKYVRRAFQRSLDNLGLDYIDLYMIHFPGLPDQFPQCIKNETFRAETWMAIAKLYDEAKVKAIGVSNFTVRHLEQLTEVMAVGPMVNQIEWHPYYYKPEMLKYCCDHNIRLQAYCSFGGQSRANNALMQEPIVISIAKRYEATQAQVLLVWALQRGVAVIPKATSPYHIKENNVLKFRLSEEDLMALDSLSVKTKKYAWDPACII